MSVKIELGSWEELMEEARSIRYDVFVIEQQVPVELEWDELDPLCVHAIARDDAGHPIATGRLLPDGHIGRMAVRKEARGSGIGAAVLEALVAAARTRGDARVMLNAQTHALAFYAKHGFAIDGEEFVEAGIPHVAMRRELLRSG